MIRPTLLLATLALTLAGCATTRDDGVSASPAGYAWQACPVTGCRMLRPSGWRVIDEADGRVALASAAHADATLSLEVVEPTPDQDVAAAAAALRFDDSAVFDTTVAWQSQPQGPLHLMGTSGQLAAADGTTRKYQYLYVGDSANNRVMRLGFVSNLDDWETLWPVVSVVFSNLTLSTGS